MKYLEWREKFQVDAINGDDADIIKEHSFGRVVVFDEKDRDGR